MDDRSFIIRVPKTWGRTTLIVAVTALIVAPLTAVASHSFTDVPDTNIFHADIDWLKDSGVTKGCNPPANTLFCPKDEVTREQMAAFMNRLANNQVVDAASVGGVPASELYTKDEVDQLIAEALSQVMTVRRVQVGEQTSIEPGACITFLYGGVSASDDAGRVTGYTVSDAVGQPILHNLTMVGAPLRHLTSQGGSTTMGMVCNAANSAQDLPEGWVVNTVNFPTS
jgi:hypothetical protein